MANDDENIVLMVVGVILVLIIIAYFVYPVYFDKYVLMNIPEYRRLSDVLDTSKKSLDEAKTTIAKYKGELDKLSKLGGTEAEMLASGRKKIELEKRIESYKRELKQFTGVVATLKNQLKESTGDAKECSKLQAAATMRMKETNDLLITEFVLDDKPLARRLQATRDSLLTLLTTSKDLVCANKGMALVLLPL
jgi:chromosome segregation ATPase